MTWGNGVIRFGKCLKFEIKTLSTASVHYLPNLLINQVTVPTVEIGKSFKYLGRFFSFQMDNIDYISEVLDLITNLMKKLAEISSHPRKKLAVCLVLFKLSKHFKFSNLGRTWVAENRDSLVSK